jgi:hypothetical protein
MPATAITLARDATFRGGLCLVSLEPKSNDLILEQAAQGRDQDPWNTLRESALAGLNGQVIPSTSDAAPGLVASVEHHLGAHHSPDVCHVQHAVVTAVSGPLATKQRAASQAAREAQARLEQAHAHLPSTGDASHPQEQGGSSQGS